MALPFVPVQWPFLQEWNRKLAEAILFLLDENRLGATFDAGRSIVDTEPSANQISSLWSGTNAEYGALTPDPKTLYVTTDATVHIYLGSTTIL